MKKVLIASFDMEVGGVERSLISLLTNFDYTSYDVDLMLYSHTGDFLNLLPNTPTLLDESKSYKTFRMSVGQIMKSGKPILGLTRILAKYKASADKSLETGFKQMQYMWNYAIPFLPRVDKRYDIAISYLWPHYFVAEKVKARTKIAWIHTDYSTIDTDIEMDLKMWNEFDYMIAVSEECRTAFIKKYPLLKKKVKVIENICSPDIVISLSNESVGNTMLEDERFKLITVARLSTAKGIDQAVKALKELKNRGYDNIAWYVVGYGGDENMISELITKEGLEDSFILLGKKINPYPYMKAADIYVQPSRYEGKAVTVGEAQILGKPIAITNYPTAKSQVQDGVDGLICEMSVNGIADGIEKLYQDYALREKLANNCRMKNYRNSDELKKLYELV
ncbi:glycosyltransferase [Virgibacillus flavescens]|uniref:glycosyltransferase n=1 Tax=Virgibacillus flavescens TaxID=1611422 RepID=UPI003D33BC5A